MSNSCRTVPEKGVDTFLKLKKQVGYKKATEIFDRITGAEFINTFGTSLTFDSEGVPTFESLMKLPIIRNYIGMQTMLDNLNKNQPHLEDNMENVTVLIDKAREFNNSNEDKDFVAIVDYDENNDITVKIVQRTSQSEEKAINQYKMHKLKQVASEILGQAGVSLESLSQIEQSLGRAGVTEFNHLANTLNEFSVVIRVANNLEGFGAISEELAHFLIGINNDKPLVKRSIEYFKNEKNARQVLGAQYDDIVKYYNGDTTMVAEEAAGHIFRDVLLDRMNNTQQERMPLFTRMFNFIVNMFKGINPAYYTDTLASIKYDYGKFADEILEGKRKIRQADIQRAKRVASFNALPEKVNVQIEALREFTKLEYKDSALQENIDKVAKTKAKYVQTAVKIKDYIAKAEKTGESMKAIAKTLSLIKDNMDLVIEQLSKLDTLPLKDKFKVLRNTLSTLTKYGKILEKLDIITAENFVTDEDIQGQNFMTDDISDSLAEFRTDQPIEKVDTSNMTNEQKVQRIDNDSKDWELSKDKTKYVNQKEGKSGLRVTTTINATKDGEEFSSNSPYHMPSTNIGTGMDELTRDFFSGRITKDGDKWKVEGLTLEEVYPNASEESLQKFCDQLKNLKGWFDSRGITIVARDIKAVGTIDTVDGGGNIHSVNVVGTLDLLGYDKQGNFYIYDMKTHRGDIDDAKEKKWRKQLTLYKRFLESKYGINVKGMGIIPISVSYPKPVGTTGGKAVYGISEKEKPSAYNGVDNNQLTANGEEFKEANPFLGKLRPLRETEIQIDYSKLADDPTNGLGEGMQVIKDTIKTCRELLSDINKVFKETSTPLFAKFLSQYIGETIEVADPDNKGKFKTITVDQLLKESDVDINWAQKMLNTMADAPNTLLQAFDQVYKQEKHKKRLKVIETAQQIIALGVKYEKLGIKDYSFMFEDDKMDYINKFYNKTKYDKAYKEFMQELDEKYGKTTIGSPEYKEKNKEIMQWIKNNTVRQLINGKKTTIPNPEIYPSKYDSLSQNQRDLYDQWMDIKLELDKLIGGDNKTHLTNTIKIRKSNIERIRSIDTGKAGQAFMEKIKSMAQKSFDDETSYAKSIRDIKGNERMVLPLLYLSTNGQSAEDISTDIISTLIAYADMAYNYDSMNNIVDALEIGKEVLLRNIKIGKRKGTGQKIKEKYAVGNTTIEGDITINPEASNIMEAINNFMESKIYERHQREFGEIMGIDGNKMVSSLTKLGSAVQLGFNFFANIASVLNGIGMANIEAAAKEYFTASDLWEADKLYFSNIGQHINDIGSRTKFSKLALMSELFDIKLEFSKNIRHTDFVNRSFITRFFGPSVQFIGQACGDHWLYHRTALALMQKYKLKLNGETISLWDAFEAVPIDPENPEAGNKLVLKEGVTKEDGSEFTKDDIVEISGKIWEMNKHLYGVYNSEDTIEARRYVIGVIGMQYRDFMPPLFRHRFGKAMSSLEGKRQAEGFYRSTGRFVWHLLQDLKNGQLNIAQSYNNLTDTEQKNIRRAIAETAQLIDAIATAALLKGDPKERPWARRVISYMSRRMVTEFGALSPIGIWSEGRKIAKSPFAATSVIDNIDGLKSLLWVPNYFDEIERGDYKGHSTAYKAFLKSPFSVWYSTVKRMTRPEKAEQYYDD